MLTIRCRRLSMFRKNWRRRLEELPTEESRRFVIAPADSKTSDGAMLISCLEGILVSAVPNWQRLKDSRLVAPRLLIGRPNLARKCRFRGWDSPRFQERMKSSVTDLLIRTCGALLQHGRSHTRMSA